MGVSPGLRICWLACCLTLITGVSGAQIDTAYIHQFSATTTIAAYTTYKDFRLTFSSAVTDGVLMQNSSQGVGLRVRHKKLGLSVSVPLWSFNESDAGRSKAFGFNFNVFPEKFYLQGTLQYIRGFESLTDLPNQPRGFHAGSRMYYCAVAGHYVLNHDRFSLGSAIQFVARQKKSAGSWIISAPLHYQAFTADSVLIPLERKPGFRINRYRSYRAGLGGGYAGSLVRGYWSLNALASGGIEFRYVAYRVLDQDNHRSKIVIGPRLRFVASILYNRSEFFVGLRGLHLPGIEKTDGLRTQIRHTRVRLIVGRRF